MNSAGPSESLFTRSLRLLGPAKLKAQLASVRLSEYVPDAAADFQGLTALDAVDHLWQLVGRPEQLPPAGDWQTWVIQAGRGFGKTRAGAQATVSAAEQASRWVAEGRIAREEARLHVIAPTSADLRDTIVEGPGGLLRCSPPWFPALYEPSKRKVSWPGGAECLLFSAEEGDRLRGPQCLWLWCDELAAWRFGADAWTNAMFGLRLGPNPRAMITTTPRASKFLRQILAQPTTIVTRGSTRDNLANLAPSAVERLYNEFGGTRLGRQELEGQLLEDNPGSLWRLDQIDAGRVAVAPVLKRIVVGVDPAVSSREGSDETGIVVCGLGTCSCQGAPDNHAFVLDDRSGIYTPDGWARVVAGAYAAHDADRVVAEKNQGGEMVESTLRTLGDANISFRAVHASKGKLIRAEPIAALSEQGKVHFVGSLPKLEDQLCQWNPMTDSWSPDRLDAYVWALTDLFERRPPAPYRSLGHARNRRI